MSTLGVHPKSRIAIELAWEITTICERCRRIQPLVHALAEAFAGCLFCQHPYGRCAAEAGGRSADSRTPTTGGTR